MIPLFRSSFDPVSGPDRPSLRLLLLVSLQRAYDALVEAGFPAVPYHKEVPPAERIANLQALKSGKAKILVCTDLAAR